MKPAWISRKSSVLVYFGLVIISYWGATLIHIRRYIVRTLEGNFDAAVSLIWCQSVTNPLRLLFGFVSPAELSFPPIENAQPAALTISYMLWEVVVDDLVFGTVFWVAVASLVIMYTSRKVRDA